MTPSSMFEIIRLKSDQAEIIDVYPTILSLMKFPAEKDVDGTSLV